MGYGEVSFRATGENIRGFAQRRLPVALCQLLSKLLDVDPFMRPGSDQVLKAIRARQVRPMTDCDSLLTHVKRPARPYACPGDRDRA